ncbi:MAG: hypothetical protein J7M11_01160 [Elusimicrobia bacterium]|nr:hypothetical protein [Elusimicrobiota bacterium]
MTDFSRRNGALTAALAIFIAQGILRAAPPAAAVKAEELYKQGNFAEAAATAEEEYSRTGDNGLKKSLIKYLTELGLDLSFKENYSTASYAFNRALALAPDDVTLKELAATSKDLSSYETTPKSPEKKASRAKPPPAAKPVNNTYLKQQRALLLKLEKLAQAIEKKSAQPAGIPADTVKKPDKLIANGENAAFAFNKVISEIGANIKKTFVATGLAVIAIIVVLIISVFLIMRYAVNRYHMLNFSAQNRAPEIGPRQKARRLPIVAPVDNTKYEGIDIIEAELSSEDSTEADVAKKLLEPFLNDTDIKLKIRAVKALHKYSKDEACKLLEEESLKGGEGIKLFCRLIQLLPPEKSIALAEKLMTLADTSARGDIANALLKINTPSLSGKLRDKINSLAGISDSKDFIIS